MVIGELKVILSAAIGDFKSRMKDAMDTVRLYGMYAKENMDKASASFQNGFKKIGEGVNTAKERITGALSLMGKAFIALGGTIALISWQGSKYAEDLWRAWVDASGKIAASGADLDKFGSSLIGMATKSKFGLNEVANAAKLAAQFNLNEAQTLDAVSAAMNYSMGVGDDLSASIDGISRAMLVFKDRNLTAKDAADILAKANVDSRVSAEDMQITLRALGPIANKLKWDFKDVVAMLAVFKDEGIDGGRVMMGLANVLNDIMDPTSALGKEIKATGVNIKDASGKVKDIVTLLRDLKNSGADTSAIFNHLNGIIGPGLSNVVDKGSGALQKYIRDFSNVDGYAKKLSTTFEKTLPGAFQFFVARLKDLPVVMSFFLKDALTNLFTPMQKALGELSAMVDKSGLAKKIDAALTPAFKAMGEWIAQIINKWTDFISKLSADDISKAIKGVQTYLKDLWNTLQKIFSGIDVGQLFKGLVTAFMLLISIIGRLGVWFSNLPDWVKNLVILGTAFMLLGGPAIVGGIASLVAGIWKLVAAIGAIKAAGGLAILSKLGIPGLLAAGAIFTGGKVIQGFKEASATSKSDDYKAYQSAGGKLGPGIWKEMQEAGHTSAFGIPLNPNAGKETPRPGVEKIKEALTEAMKIETDFAKSLDKEFETMGMNTDELNGEIEKTRAGIQDETKNFMSTFTKTGDKIVNLNNETINLMIQSQNKVAYLQARLDALEKRVASIRITQSTKKQGL